MASKPEESHPPCLSPEQTVPIHDPQRTRPVRHLRAAPPPPLHPEFASREGCENAYKKMENVLIDDRRIHVDFSQSVAQLWRSFNDQKKGKKVKMMELQVIVAAPANGSRCPMADRTRWGRDRGI